MPQQDQQQLGGDIPAGFRFADEPASQKPFAQQTPPTQQPPPTQFAPGSIPHTFKFADPEDQQKHQESQEIFAPHLGRRTYEGVKESVQGAAAIPRMVLAPPQDATEHAIASASAMFPMGGQAATAGIAAWRLAKAIVDSVKHMENAKPEDFRKAVEDFHQLTKEFHDQDYRNALASAVTMAGHTMSFLDTPGTMDLGQRTADIGAGLRPGGNLAGPLAKAATDVGLMYASEKIPEVVAARAAAAEKYSLKTANGLLRANKPRDYMYDREPGRALLDRRIRPTRDMEVLWEQLDDVGRQINQEILQKLNDPVIAARRTNIAPEMNNIIDDALRDIQQHVTLTKRQAVVAQLENLRDETLGKFNMQGKLVGGYRAMPMSPAELVSFRRSMGKSIAWDAFEKDPEMREFMGNVYKEMYARANNRLDAMVGDRSIRDLNKQWSENIEARRLLARRIVQEEKSDVGMNNLLHKSELFGGAHLILSGEPLTGAALLANRASRTPFARVFAAQTADKAAHVLERSAPVAKVAAGAGVASVVAGQQRRKQEEENPQ